MRYRHAPEAFFCVFLLVLWMGLWGPSWMIRGLCVYGWGGWQDSARLPLPALVLGSCPVCSKGIRP